MTIYNITDIVSNSFPLACTPNNITAGFKKRRIFPLNVIILNKHDFMPAFTTNRSNPELGHAMKSLVLSVNNVTHLDFTILENNKPEANCSKHI